MLVVNALKTVCDLLLCLTFAALIGPYSEAWLLMGVVLALGFLSTLILQKTDNSLLARILCGLLPALDLFAAQSLAEVIITAIILAFYFALTLAGKNVIHYEDYQYWFGFPAVPVAVVLIITLSYWPVRPASSVCAAAYLFLGILVLRRKRMGAGAGTKLRLLNVVELVGVVVFAVLACILLYAAITHSGKVLETLLLPLGFLITGVVYVVDWLLGLITHKPLKEPLYPEEPEPVEPEEYVPAESLPTVPEDVSVYTQVETVVLVLLAILAAVAVVYFAWKFYRKVRGIRSEEAGDAEAIEEGEGRPLGSGRRRRKRRKLSRPSNRERIRAIYRDYLAYIRTCGVEIGRQTTSAEILEAADKLPSSDEAERLRELYIRARYHDAEDMSEAEVEEAEALLTRIKEPPEAEQTGNGMDGA